MIWPSSGISVIKIIFTARKVAIEWVKASTIWCVVLSKKAEMPLDQKPYIAVKLLLAAKDDKAVHKILSLPSFGFLKKRTIFNVRVLTYWYIHCVSEKNKTPNSCPWLPQMLTDFQNSFSGRLTGKFATNSYLNIPPHLKCVATLPCKISMFKNRNAQEVI